MSVERLQKVLARAGVASRRKAEELIAAGRVEVGGRTVTELGTKVDPKRDRIRVDGRPISPETPVYVLLHKPRGVVSTTRDPEGRKTVLDLVADVGARLVPVGRLDYHTSGVLLLTNDGDFAEGLLHPRHRVPRTYVVKVHGTMSDDDVRHWAEGVRIGDRRTAPADVRRLRHDRGKTWLEVTLREGQNRQILRMGEATGFPVWRLARLSFAGVTAEGLRPGQWRLLTRDELADLKRRFGVPKRVSRRQPTRDRSKKRGRTSRR